MWSSHSVKYEFSMESNLSIRVLHYIFSARCAGPHLSANMSIYVKTCYLCIAPHM